MPRTKKPKVKVKMVRKRRPLTENQKVFVKKIGDGVDPVSAHMEAYGSDKETAQRHVARTMKSKAIKDLMNLPKIGLSDEYLLGRLKRALLAKRLVWSKGKGDWLEEVDWATQVKALEIAFKLKGHLSSKNIELDPEQIKEINVTFNLVKARSIEEIAKLTKDTSIGVDKREPVLEKQDEEKEDSKVQEGEIVGEENVEDF